MKTFFARTYVLLLHFYGLCANTSETYSDVFKEMADLHELCPFSTFCDINVTLDIPNTEDNVPCCKSCSCDIDCGLRGDCCFEHLNKHQTKEQDNMICVSTVLVKEAVRNPPYFRMVNKCNTIDSEPDSFCGQNASFRPVVSLDTGLIYYNGHCAECNGAKNIITWKTAFTCLSAGDAYLPEIIEGFTSSNFSFGNSGCFAYYIPPSGLNLASEACDPSIVRKCNVTGIMEKTEHYWKYCEMFNGTYTQVKGGISFGNVYCYLCNVLVNEFATDTITDKWCPNKGGDVNYGKIHSAFPLTVIMNTTSSQKNLAPKTETETSECPENSKLITSYETSCRPLKCPWGQMRFNNKCGYQSTSWIGGPFAVMLRLTPVGENSLIPLSFFTELPMAYKYDRKAKWLKRNALKQWNFVFLYHHAQNKAFVDFIVVKATYPSNSVNPNHLAKLVKAALRDTWLMTYGNSTITLNVTLNKYNMYDYVTFEVSENATHVKEFCPVTMICVGLSVQNKFCEKERIYPVLQTDENQLNGGIFVTELFFCDQVELFPEEFTYRCLALYFKVRNKTLHSFHKIVNELNGDLKVRVCVDEFPLAGVSVSLTTTRSTELLAIFLMAICLFK